MFDGMAGAVEIIREGSLATTGDRATGDHGKVGFRIDNKLVGRTVDWVESDLATTADKKTV